MLSTENANINFKFPIKKEFFDKIKDCDISSYSKTIITWPSVISLNERSKKHFQKTIDLITVLETKLQMAWNHSFTISNIAEDPYIKNIKTKELKSIFWRFTNSLNSTRGVLSSTMSTRAQLLFDEIVSTSKIEQQLMRLEEKLIYIEKCIDQRNTQTNRFFQKVVEFLLLMTASVSIIQLSFELPILSNPLYGISLTGFLILLGTISIFKGR